MVEINKLLDFNNWAASRVMDQVKTLTDEMFYREIGSSFPSIRLTLLHMMEADWIWLNRWKGLSTTDLPKEWDTSTAVALEGIWSGMRNEMQEMGKLLSKSASDITFVTRNGTPCSMPFAEIVMHVVNHGTYHRGQVVSMLRILGIKPVNTDYFIYYSLEKA